MIKYNTCHKIMLSNIKFLSFIFSSFFLYACPTLSTSTWWWRLQNKIMGMHQVYRCQTPRQADTGIQRSRKVKEIGKSIVVMMMMLLSLYFSLRQPFFVVLTCLLPTCHHLLSLDKLVTTSSCGSFLSNKA